MLVDRGHLSYDTHISEIWPEFSRHRKDSFTVADLLRHEVGLSNFEHRISSKDLQRAALKNRSISQVIADSKSDNITWFGRSHSRYYHSVTRDFITNEIVMRVDPKSRTIGEFLRDEIVRPLGLNGEITLGDETLQAAIEGRVADLTQLDGSWYAWQALNFVTCRYRLPRMIVFYATCAVVSPSKSIITASFLTLRLYLRYLTISNSLRKSRISPHLVST